MTATYDVVVVGAGFGVLCAGIKLLEAGVTNFVILEKADDVMSLQRTTRAHGLDGHLRFCREVTSSVFDDGTDTWTLRTRSGESYRGRVVIAAPGPLHVPSVPEFAGLNDFRGVSFHSAEWDHDFDPAGKRIAVIGTGAGATQFIPQLAKSAASLAVFQCTPHWVIPKLDRPISRAEHWLFRTVPGAAQKAFRYGKRIVVASDYYPALQRPNVELVTSGIDRITKGGIRTADGADREVDAIIYGTGFAISDRIADQVLVGTGGLTIQQAWRDGMEADLGVTVHGFPNYFLVMGPNSGGDNQSIVLVIEAQVNYILECLKLMEREGSTRMEVRRSTQRRFNEPGSSLSYWRRMRRPVPSAFDLSSGAGVSDEIYDGPATLTLGDSCHGVRVRLTGHLDPIDGRYHWQGTVFDPLPADILKRSQAVALAVGDRAAEGRVVEQTPWGTHTIAGVGAPPFALDEVEVAVPQLPD